MSLSNSEQVKELQTKIQSLEEDHNIEVESITAFKDKEVQALQHECQVLGEYKTEAETLSLSNSDQIAELHLKILSLEDDHKAEIESIASARDEKINTLQQELLAMQTNKLS